MPDKLAEQVEELRRLETLATPGPWKVTTCMDYWVEAVNGGADAGVAHCGDVSWPDYEAKQKQWEANARLIAATRNALPSLLSALEQRERDAAELVKFGSDLVNALEREASTEMAAQVATDNYSHPGPEVNKAVQAKLAAAHAITNFRNLLKRVPPVEGTL